MKHLFILFVLVFCACDHNDNVVHHSAIKKRILTFDCSQYNEDVCLFEAGQKCGSDYITKWINHNDKIYAISVECK